MNGAIAIVGMACQYPDARSPSELWENVLAQRRAFRRLPPERLRLEDYWSADRDAPDRTYLTEAALIEGYEFDRVRFRVAGSTFRSADLAHWLALDVAAQALTDAGFPGGEGLPRDTTGVLLGNTLTGEFSRVNVLRLRWPYVRRVVEAALHKEGWTPEQRRVFLEELEARYKEPFPPVGEETLAGGLSNTIAGRICNHFDLKGGGYTVDGACAASLLAVTTACSALSAGDLDVAIAGGVDVSLDPFELVGFAKIGALAPEEMRVYDARAAGFWPGEGCGFVVLMRYEDALAQRRRLYASIRGWGISSDGSGGITRPEVEGQLLAVRRAYRRAGFGIETASYFEGHGTGTAVGDAAELQALSRARREAASAARPAVIGSVKANIGHTKAAAGLAGLIKATMAVYTQVLPPTTGCEKPQPELVGEAPVLRVLSKGEPWPAERPLCAGVSAMGFGGINTHIVLEGVADERRTALSSQERRLLSSAQDAELFLLGAQDTDDLRRQVEHLLTFAARLSRAELADLAAQLVRTLPAARLLDTCQVRAAVVASSPAELTSRLKTLLSWLAKGEGTRLDIPAGVFLGVGVASPRIGFLFPGQGSPVCLNGGALERRFECVQELYTRANLPIRKDDLSTATAQPAIVTASMAALRVLNKLGVTADIAVGHSLGELTALHWAGALDEEALLRITAVRGQAMAELGNPAGAMASIEAGQQHLKGFLNGGAVVLAGLNSPDQTVISGEAAAVDEVIARAGAQGLRAVRLPVSRAFHSPLVAAATPMLAEQLSREAFQPVRRTVVSTVTGSALAPDEDLRALLVRQVTSPVRFTEAMAVAAQGVDLLLEIGPGRVLSGLAAEFVEIPTVAVDVGGPSVGGLLRAVGAAFVLGAPVKSEALFAERFTRPFNLDWRPRFFVNPCELAPVSETAAQPVETGGGRRKAGDGRRETEETETVGDIELREITSKQQACVDPDSSNPQSAICNLQSPLPNPQSILALVQQLVAERAELPPAAVKADDRLLSDLHLNSISVGRLVAEAARRLNLPPPVAPTDYADAKVAEVAQALEEFARTGGATLADKLARLPSGVDSWTRTFTVELAERPLPRRQPPVGAGAWQVVAHADYPLLDSLQQAFAHAAGGPGVLVCLPPESDERHVGLLLEGARAALAKKDATRFVLVQHGGGAASFARTLHLEAPRITTCVVDVPVHHPQAVEWVVAEALAAVRYTEAHYDLSGRRRAPVLRLLQAYGGKAASTSSGFKSVSWVQVPSPLVGEGQGEGAVGNIEVVASPHPNLPPQGGKEQKERATEPPLGSADVLLVTGGGKGIAAECALFLARETGVRLALLGRSQPSADTELAANLERMAAAGVTFRYFSADVVDAEAIRMAIREAEGDLGVITAILHGAGANTPQLLASLDEAAFLRTLAPKVQGARNVLAAVNSDSLRLFITFGSIIARTGMRGEADYALANEWLTSLTERFQAEHPHCRCLALEWSVWSGVGMGERLGRIDALVREGITPIPPDEGIAILRGLVAQPPPVVSAVVTGRFGEAPTLKVEQPDLPFFRFLEQTRVYYPGVELIVDAELSGDTDPYLADHVFQGERLFPAVMGLEAMAQASMALMETVEPPIFAEVQFSRPVVIPERASVTIRVAALVRGPNQVEVVLRSEETAFQVDHFRATCRFGLRSSKFQVPELVVGKLPPVAIDPERDLYGSLLFHKGRFQRLRGYRRLKATECVAEVAPDDATNWFGRYTPSTLVLGDPGARDAAIHAIQACIPHITLLPIGVHRFTPGVGEAPGPWFVRARERERGNDTFTYDVEVLGADGYVRERWEGLQLRMVSAATRQAPWIEPLLGPYIERRVPELIPGATVAVTVERDAGMERRARSDRALQRALGETAPIWRRPDGKPEVTDGRAVSAAHAGDLTLAVAGSGPVGCDVEPVSARPAAGWRDLLGRERFTLAEVISQENGEDQDTTATRVWAASECLKKAGAVGNAPLVLASTTADGWVQLAAGPLRTATYVTSVRGGDNRLALAVLVRNGDARL